MNLAKAAVRFATAALAASIPALIAQQAGEDTQARKIYEDLIQAPIIPRALREAFWRI